MVRNADRESTDKYWEWVATGSNKPPEDFPAPGYTSPYQPENHPDAQEESAKDDSNKH